MKKKGISPLIATVLILGFTVALAAIIMTWGTSFTKGIQKGTEEEATAQIKCSTDVDIKITCDCSATQCKYRIINNEASTINKIRTRFFDVNGNFLGTDSQTPNVVGWDVSAEYTKLLSSTGNNIKIELLVEEATIGGALFKCGSSAVFEGTCI